MDIYIDHKTKSLRSLKVYLGFAYFLLIILAVFWSVDNSVIYILTGLVLNFIYLAIKSYHNHIDQQTDNNNFERHEDPEVESADLPNVNYNTVFEKGVQHNQEASTTVSSIRKPLQRSVVIIIGGFFFISFIAFFVQMVLGGEEEAQFNYQSGESFYAQGQYDSARRYYKKAIDLDQEYSEALTGFGNVLMINQQYDSAVVMYDKAMSFNADFEPALYQKALVLYYQKHYDESIKEAKKLLNANSSYFDGMQLIGDDYYNQNEYDSALLWYDVAYKNGLRNRYLCHLMGYIYQTKDKNDKAISLYKEALQYDSTVIDIYERLGELIPGEEGNWFRVKTIALKPHE